MNFNPSMLLFFLVSKRPFSIPEHSQINHCSEELVKEILPIMPSAVCDYLSFREALNCYSKNKRTYMKIRKYGTVNKERLIGMLPHQEYVQSKFRQINSLKAQCSDIRNGNYSFIMNQMLTPKIQSTLESISDIKNMMEILNTMNENDD